MSPGLIILPRCVITGGDVGRGLGNAESTGQGGGQTLQGGVVAAKIAAGKNKELHTLVTGEATHASRKC
jgi:hypothetical protein